MSLPLLHSPANVVRWLLVALNVGANPKLDLTGKQWPIYAYNEPNTPDDVITVYKTGNRQFGRSQPDGEQLQHYGVQVRVRSMDPNTGFSKAQAILNLFSEHVYANLITPYGDSNVYEVFSIDGSDVVDIGKEAGISKRAIHVINAVAVIRRLT